MKKFFTLIVAGMAMIASTTASAGTPTVVSHTLRQSVARPVFAHSSSSRATSCDTLINLDFSTADSNAHIYGFDTPNVGLFSGTGALYAGQGQYLPITQVGELFTASLPGGYVTSATVFLEALTLNPTHADSTLTITAYVYDTTGTSPGPGGGIAPGLRPIDSATANMSFILANGGALFTFTHQAVLPGRQFFIMVGIPQIPGDTIALLTNDGSTNNGHLWYNTPVGGVSIHGISGGNLESGAFIFATICGLNSCPTITVSATQIGTTGSAYATATGGVAPYSYAWNTTPVQNNDTATGLSSRSYVVTATDANGCTGTRTIIITVAGINDIAGMTDFVLYPNPSTGVFNASFSLEAAADVTTTVVSMTGSKVYESTDKSVKEYNKSINLSSMAAGVYVVNVKTATGSVNHRITIQ